VRSRPSPLLGHPYVHAVLAPAPVAVVAAPLSGVTSALVAVPGVSVEPETPPVRLILTRRAWQGERVSVGKPPGEGVAEGVITAWPADGFHATDGLDR
jgi:hypothetical protein